jgi:hypothetical protein
MRGRQFLEAIIEANNIVSREGLQGREEFKRLEEDPIDLGSRGVVGGVGPGLRDSTMDGNNFIETTINVIRRHHVEAAVCQKPQSEWVDTVRLPMVRSVGQPLNIESVDPFGAFLVFPW